MQFKIWRGEGGKQLRQKVYYGRSTNRGNFPPPGSIILTRLLSSRSLILATCDNLTSKSHYSRVYNFVWGLERHGPVRIDGWCFSFGKEQSAGSNDRFGFDKVHYSRNRLCPIENIHTKYALHRQQFSTAKILRIVQEVHVAAACSSY